MLKYLLVTLLKEQYNLRILHWMAKGKGFNTNHLVVDDYISKFSEYIDKVAELMLIQDEKIPSDNEVDVIAKQLKIRKLLVRNYDSETIYKVINNIFNNIINIIKECDKEYPSFITSELDSIEYWFQLEANYKNKQKMS